MNEEHDCLKSGKILDKRNLAYGTVIRRRKVCLRCSKRWTTYEFISEDNEENKYNSYLRYLIIPKKRFNKQVIETANKALKKVLLTDE